MARPLRIEYPDAWYHVMNRGRRAEKIFTHKTDYHAFLDLLLEAAELWKLRIAGFCLMPTHYHLLVQTPNANLSRCMRHINGVYTQRFNRSHGCDGQLFRGRYKAVLVDADTYLLQLLRYIHRNPLRAGLADSLNAYVWTSHRGYVSGAKQWKWLYKDFILAMFAEDKKLQRRRYEHFVAQDDSEEITSLFQKKKLPSIVGPKEFTEWMKEQFFSEKSHKEVPEAKSLAPDTERIKQCVCQTYRVLPEALLKSKRGISNEPRNVAIYLTRFIRGAGLTEICREYHLNKYSSASSAVERVKGHMAKDRQFRRHVEKLGVMLTKSQTET